MVAYSPYSRACSTHLTTSLRNTELCGRSDDISITSCTLAYAQKPSSSAPILRWQRLRQREARWHDRDGWVLDSAAEHAEAPGRGGRLYRRARLACAL